MEKPIEKTIAQEVAKQISDRNEKMDSQAKRFVASNEELLKGILFQVVLSQQMQLLILKYSGIDNITTTYFLNEAYKETQRIMDTVWFQKTMAASGIEPNIEGEKK